MVEGCGYWLDEGRTAPYASIMRTDAWKESVKLLGDHFGLYQLVVVCPKCKHERYMQPDTLVLVAASRGLAEKVNAMTEIATAMRYMRCHLCETKGAEWRVERVPRPRDRGFPR